VLGLFGRAFGKLPDSSSQWTKDQIELIHKAVNGLAQDRKVVSVRIALFAEMMKSRDWTTVALREVGGTQGIGTTFLEETFSATTAPYQHRLHQKAARSLLSALLPETGSNIKGHIRSKEQLLIASGYEQRPRDFDDLIRILDSEVRLITPAGKVESGKLQFENEVASELLTQNAQLSTKLFYQLTHDYLVPSLRDWLTRKQRETRKGRAELKLAERATTWDMQRENKQLPSMYEWLSIRFLTNSADWTVTQREMMSRTGRLIGIQSALTMAALIAFVAIGIVVRTQVRQKQEAIRIEGLVQQLTSAEPAKLPEIIKELDAYPEIDAKYLLPLIAVDGKTIDEQRMRLHAQLAMVARDKSLVEPLLEELLTTKTVAYIGPIRQQLRPYASELTERLWTILRDEKADTDRRFHAAAALADYVPESDAAPWTGQDLRFVAEQLLSSNAEFQSLLRENLQPISGRLIPDLEKIFEGSAKTTDAQRLSAANAFADYAAKDISKLTRLLPFANPDQFKVLYPLVEAASAPSTVEDLSKIASTLPPDDLVAVDRIGFGQRRANAAVTMLRLGEREKVLPVFDWTDDPEALTQFIFRCRDRGVRVKELLDMLQIVTRNVSEGRPINARIRYALLLAIGEYKLEEIPAAQREELLKQLGSWYRNDPSSGVHGAAGWLLRQWGQADVVRKVDQTAVPYTADREWFTLAITVTSEFDRPSDIGQAIGEKDAQPDQAQNTLAGNKGQAEAIVPQQPHRSLYYTFIVFPAGEYTIGSPIDEPGRTTLENRETRHLVRITRPFALLDREVVFEELIAFSSEYLGLVEKFKTQRSDAGAGVNWYDSVGFCRWLGMQSGLSESDQAYAAPESLNKEDFPRESNKYSSWAVLNWPVDLSRRGFRLPTEAEWEIACRAGARTAYTYGGEARMLDQYGWFNENSSKRVHRPRELRPNSRGLFDLHGNLLEWTHDWFGDFGTEATIDPVGPQKGSSRVIRGFSWGNPAVDCRSASRISNHPTQRAINVGFRLAISIPPDPVIQADQDK
jgi:formylglycine-generating enzyme required for sulfatase activity